MDASWFNGAPGDVYGDEGTARHVSPEPEVVTCSVCRVVIHGRSIVSNFKAYCPEHWREIVDRRIEQDERDRLEAEQDERVTR